jgi:hypothetical protein
MWVYRRLFVSPVILVSPAILLLFTVGRSSNPNHNSKLSPNPNLNPTQHKQRMKAPRTERTTKEETALINHLDSAYIRKHRGVVAMRKNMVKSRGINRLVQTTMLYYKKLLYFSSG